MRKLLATTSIAFTLLGCGVSSDSETTKTVELAVSTPDLVTLTLPVISNQLAEGKLSSVELVQAYLDRIEAIDLRQVGVEHFSARYFPAMYRG